METLKDEIRTLRDRFARAAAEVRDENDLQELRNLFLSRKNGHLTRLLESMKTLAPALKPAAGREINAIKQHVQSELDRLEQIFLRTPSRSGPGIDLTLPGRISYWGAPHPVLHIKDRIEQIFQRMGFSIEDGPELETDYYNFEALNFPPHHPARDDWDTLYIDDDLLLRTHTSPVQIRVMEKRKPPIRMINPGKVYRKETPDPTHLPMFFQVEGLVVDHGITFAHLKGTLEAFLKSLYHERIKIRFRPSFFPFTEPSAEVDIGCTVCTGEDEDCRVCRGTGWLEILGAGMVDPQVFKNVNIDPEVYSGFAFGMGIERTAMFSLQIPDLRYFYENDLRFIRQFSKQ